MEKLKHYLGKNTATHYDGTVRGHGYEYWICDDCGKPVDEPRNKLKVDLLYLVSFPLKLFGQKVQDRFVDSFNN